MVCTQTAWPQILRLCVRKAFVRRAVQSQGYNATMCSSIVMNQAFYGILFLILSLRWHHLFLRFQPKYFSKQSDMTKDDYMIVCGDFGGVWFGDKRDNAQLDELEQLPFTVLFVGESWKLRCTEILPHRNLAWWQGAGYSAPCTSLDARTSLQLARLHLLHDRRRTKPWYCRRYFGAGQPKLPRSI